jgi:tRNA threonylcarbamoyladenosine modification (KEOPS) complex Cgi121 subunit
LRDLLKSELIFLICFSKFALKNLFLEEISELMSSRILAIKASDYILIASFVSSAEKVNGEGFLTLGDVIASKFHLAFSFGRAVRSFKEGRNIARSIENEVICNILGDRQVERALRIAKANKPHFFLLLIGKDLEETIRRYVDFCRRKRLRIEDWPERPDLDLLEKAAIEVY